MLRVYPEDPTVELSPAWRREVTRLEALVHEAMAVYRELCEASVALADAGEPFDLLGCQVERDRWIAAIEAYKRVGPGGKP